MGLLLLGQGLRGLRLDPPAAADPQPETLHTAPMRVPARLIAVIDGDTIDVEIEGARRRIRYLGMDTPERGEPLYAEATRRNRELLAAGTLLLERDQSETDRYGRLLRWVLLEDGTLVNEVLVREGLARAQIWDPDVRYAEAIKSAEQEARANQVGLWITAGQ